VVELLWEGWRHGCRGEVRLWLYGKHPLSQGLPSRTPPTCRNVRNRLIDQSPPQDPIIGFRLTKAILNNFPRGAPTRARVSLILCCVPRGRLYYHDSDAACNIKRAESQEEIPRIVHERNHLFYHGARPLRHTRKAPCQQLPRACTGPIQNVMLFKNQSAGRGRKRKGIGTGHKGIQTLCNN
jgi:hypothetical protein